MNDQESRLRNSLRRNLDAIEASTRIPDDVASKARTRRFVFMLGAGTAILIAATAVWTLSTLFSDPSQRNPASSSNTSTPSPSIQEDQGPHELVWPEPFVPRTVAASDRALMSVIFPDQTAVTLSYPAELRLAERGVQVTMSFRIKDGRPSAPHDIIFIPGDPPPGLLDPKPLETFDAIPFPAALHSVDYQRLRDDPPYALVYQTELWTIVATFQQRADANAIARYLHPSVTVDEWPSIFASGPIELSEGFGEARGAHLEVGDRNPLFDIVDAGDRFTYIVMGPVAGCGRTDDGVSGASDDSYGAKCLELDGGEQGIFLSIYGPEQFVQTAYAGIELEE